MNPEERAALERLLEYVGRGFCAVQADCRMLRKYLAASATTARTVEAMQVVARLPDMPDGGSRLLIQAKRPLSEQPTVTYEDGKAPVAREFVFDPAALDARVLCIHPALIPARLLRICKTWESATGTLMTRPEMKRHPWMCFRPWQWTWVAISDRASRLRKARKR